MHISIAYESSWRNSFLDGSNNKELPKNGRKFIGSIRALGTAENYLKRDITLDTIMGLLNRLIGDQRKLYQSRQDPKYFFKDIESQVTFEDIPKFVSNEVVYLRNITGNTDRNSYTGMIKISDPAFSSDYSEQLWGVLALSIDELCNFILNDIEVSKCIDLRPLAIVDAFEDISKLKPLSKEGEVKKAFDYLSLRFKGFKGLNAKGDISPLALYCSSLYLQLERLQNKFDVSSVKTKNDKLSGISKNGFTKKGFMSKYTTGREKKVWGNPYIQKQRIKGLGEVTSVLKKASGKLEIEISVSQEKALEIKTMIENAGVSSFYLGKKGLAYVTHIRL